ncbi:extracellular solute-binding protein [Paenibacillus oenotherae]|uniref:Maltodextrin-binding protein n=1 Tax=Paenibacillus oenotherae TaxID=1435645 RepID=A0ABS7D6M4_9BACL|nr:extracellular solute-binding protein [Paenibacillus oenotherae]MBW7475197.1 extracellular solute-binding protein [Paenibacillus oenotherae]
MGETEKNKELVIWHEFDGPGDTSIEVLEEICRLYGERNGVNVISEVMGIQELGERLVAIERTGVGPHMAFVPADMVVFKEKARLSEAPVELFSAELGENVRSSMTMEGTSYGVPILTGNHLVLYYNKDILPQPPVSWEEVEQLSDELKQRGIKPIGGDMSQSYWFMPFFTAFGGWPIKDGKADLTNESMRSALQFVRNKIDQGILANLDGSTALLEQFIDGEIGAIICGEWIFNYLDRRMGQKLGVAKLPDIGGKPSLPLNSSIGLIYPNESLDSETRELILSFTRFMLSEECQMKWAEQVQRIPTNSAVQRNLLEKGSPNKQSILSLLEFSRTMPIHPNMIAIWASIGAGLDVLQQNSSEDAFNAIVKKEEANHIEVR